MIHKPFRLLNLSALGFGTMHLPVIDGNDAMIDKAATEEMVAYAVQRGINYIARWPCRWINVPPLVSDA